MRDGEEHKLVYTLLKGVAFRHILLVLKGRDNHGEVFILQKMSVQAQKRLVCISRGPHVHVHHPEMGCGDMTKRNVPKTIVRVLCSIRCNKATDCEGG